MCTVTTKGHVLIPKHIREILGVTPGETDVEFTVVDDKIQLINKKSLTKKVTKEKISIDEVIELTQDIFLHLY